MGCDDGLGRFHDANGFLTFTRRCVLVALGLIALLGVSPAPGMAQMPTMAQALADPLPSWNEGAAKRAIIDFVRATTDPANAGFVPPADRIATFD